MKEVQIWPYGYTDEELYGYEIVTWPDTQAVIESEDMPDDVYLINDEEGLSLYGSAAYIVPVAWWNELNK